MTNHNIVIGRARRGLSVPGLITLYALQAARAGRRQEGALSPSPLHPQAWHHRPQGGKKRVLHSSSGHPRTKPPSLPLPPPSPRLQLQLCLPVAMKPAPPEGMHYGTRTPHPQFNTVLEKEHADLEPFQNKKTKVKQCQALKGETNLGVSGM